MKGEGWKMRKDADKQIRKVDLERGRGKEGVWCIGKNLLKFNVSEKHCILEGVMYQKNIAFLNRQRGGVIPMRYKAV